MIVRYQNNTYLKYIAVELSGWKLGCIANPKSFSDSTNTYIQAARPHPTHTNALKFTKNKINFTKSRQHLFILRFEVNIVQQNKYFLHHWRNVKIYRIKYLVRITRWQSAMVWSRFCSLKMKTFENSLKIFPHHIIIRHINFFVFLFCSLFACGTFKRFREFNVE